MIWTASREATFEHVLRVAMLAGAAGVGLVYGARPRAALSLAAGLAIFGAVAAGVVEAKLLAGDADAFAGSRLSWPINYAPADAALVWLPLPALVAFAAAHPLRPVVRGPSRSLPRSRSQSDSPLRAVVPQSLSPVPCSQPSSSRETADGSVSRCSPSSCPWP